MTETIKGSADRLEPEFLHALGIAVTTFAHLEGVLMNAFFAARHQSQDYASFPDTALEIYDANFTAKIDMVFKTLNANIKQSKPQDISALQDEFHAARQARNFVVHGVWQPGSKKGSYRCLMIDRGGRTVRNEADTDTILAEAARAEKLMIRLKSVLVAEGLYPATGPKISQGDA